MTESRAVQFALQVFVDLIAFYIVLSSEALYLPVCIFVGVELFVGLVISGYLFITLYNIFYDDQNHDDSDADLEE